MLFSLPSTCYYICSYSTLIAHLWTSLIAWTVSVGIKHCSVIYFFYSSFSGSSSLYYCLGSLKLRHFFHLHLPPLTANALPNYSSMSMRRPLISYPSQSCSDHGLTRGTSACMSDQTCDESATCSTWCPSWASYGSLVATVREWSTCCCRMRQCHLASSQFIDSRYWLWLPTLNPLLRH